MDQTYLHTSANRIRLIKPLRPDRIHLPKLFHIHDVNPPPDNFIKVRSRSLETCFDIFDCLHLGALGSATNQTPNRERRMKVLEKWRTDRLSLNPTIDNLSSFRVVAHPACDVQRTAFAHDVAVIAIRLGRPGCMDSFPLRRHSCKSVPSSCR